MAWVQRNQALAITGVYSNQQVGLADEQLSDSDASVVAYFNPPKQQTVLSQDVVDQFTAVDYGKIKTAVGLSDASGLKWVSLQAQSEPMIITSTRFLAIWNDLVKILGQPRMNAIATALGVPSLVV